MSIQNLCTKEKYPEVCRSDVDSPISFAGLRMDVLLRAKTGDVIDLLHRYRNRPISGGVVGLAVGTDDVADLINEPE